MPVQQVVIKIVMLGTISILLYTCNHSVEETSCEFGSMKYYAYCGFGGILSCGLTHTAVVPLDVVKCRVQVYIYICIYSDPGLVGPRG